MAVRTIIEIDQDACDGCGACATGCPEGALKVIDGKARLVGESLCDGLGACIGKCPRGAITITEREASDYDEVRVVKEILPQGQAVLLAHFEHLDHHGQDLYLKRAVEYLAAEGLPIPAGYEKFAKPKPLAPAQGCPGMKAHVFAPKPATSAASIVAPRAAATSSPSGSSALGNWPIQLHLANPRAPHFAGADVLIAADCTAFALGSFHGDLLAGKSLLIACPKLDSGREIYADKLASIIGQAASVTIAIMEVPCCSGLLKLAQDARTASGSAIPLETVVIGIDGGFVARKRF
jgi:NAD-dependent dihydropyrimidine dehydrogenase PreA subunit